jgi:hypothetical protein
MTQAELTRLNLGKSLDNLMNLDPRGYGVCNILYSWAHKLAGEPLTMHAAAKLLSTLKAGDTVYFVTGFVLHPFNKQETDGPPGAAALARTLVQICGIKSVFIVPAEAKAAMESLAVVMDFSADVVEFTKDAQQAAAEAERIVSEARTAGNLPAYCIAIEAAGADKSGVYHNAVGIDVTLLQAKSDVLFTRLQQEGVPTLAVGDLGNECGMGTLGSEVLSFVPCIAAAACADTVLTATVSNWGAWGIASALVFLARKPTALYPPALEQQALEAANRCGLIDRYGEEIPAVDGMNLTKNKAIITLMNECVISALELEETCKTWFEKTLALGFFELPKHSAGS